DRDDRQYAKGAAALAPQGGQIFTINTTYTGPFDHTEHYFGDGFRWDSQLAESIPPSTPDGFPLTVNLTSQSQTYLAGQTYNETWNQAVYSPAFPSSSLVSGGPPQRFSLFLSLAPSML